MGVKKISGRGPAPAAAHPPEASPTRTGEAGETRPAGRPEPALPPPEASLRGRKSPLETVIRDGLKQLARAEGWEAQKNALDVLVGAMTRNRGPGEPASAPAGDPSSVRGFERLLEAHAGPEARAAVRADARQLARLAVVALGSEGLDGRRADRALQLESDLGELRKGLSAVLERPDPERTERLTRVTKDLEWVGSVLARSRETQPVQPRVDAVAAILELLLRYVVGSRTG